MRVAVWRGAECLVLLSRSPPSGDLVAWKRVEAAAIAAARKSNYKSLVVLRTAELIGGPYYALNMDLSTVSNAKYITTSHNNVRIQPADNKGRGMMMMMMIQRDFGTSRPIVSRVVEAAITAANKRAKTFKPDRLEVSILNVVSVPGASPSHDALNDLINDAMNDAVQIVDTTPDSETVPTEIDSSSSHPTIVKRDLEPLTTPQRTTTATNPFLAIPAVAGPYYFLVFLIITGFGLAANEWTWCDVHWAVDPKSPFHLAVTEQTCSCRDGDYRVCRPEGDLEKGHFRFLDGMTMTTSK